MLAPANRLLGGGEAREFPSVDEAGLPQHVVLEGREEVATGAAVIGDRTEGTEELRDCWACSGDVKRWRTRSRRRVGRWLFSARLFSPLWRRCSTPGSTWRSAGG